ncbi:hypothetical protein MTR_2g059575 [Medicago truncatula]|uniref:Uncharacterized protein n=1 Tax=Medicago truncatula TaxID=3880 RepID=A0A072VIQ2_MEDTR|nr:hypothetical protein MTR_2g059575 [Medicago truncatula]
MICFLEKDEHVKIPRPLFKQLLFSYLLGFVLSGHNQADFQTLKKQCEGQKYNLNCLPDSALYLCSKGDPTKIMTNTTIDRNWVIFPRKGYALLIYSEVRIRDMILHRYADTEKFQKSRYDTVGIR